MTSSSLRFSIEGKELGINMWIVDRWKDYDVLDISSRRKAGKVGDYILVDRTPRSFGIRLMTTEDGSRRMDITIGAQRGVGNGNFSTCQMSGPSLIIWKEWKKMGSPSI